MRAPDKLRLYWDKKEDDLGGFHPLGSQTRPDLYELFHRFKGLAEELERRGYDHRTLKFEVCPRKGCEKFASQRECRE